MVPLVWNINRTVCVTVVCTIMMMHNGTSCSWLTVSGFDLAWFSSVSSVCLCVFGIHGAVYIYLNFLFLPPMQQFIAKWYVFSSVHLWVSLSTSLSNRSRYQREIFMGARYGQKLYSDSLWCTAGDSTSLMID